MLSINSEKFNQVATKLDLDPKDIKRAKRKKILKSLSYPFIQLGVNITTVITLIFSNPLFSSETFLRPTYPANFLTDVLFTIINPFFWIIQIGNITGSITLRKKVGMRTGMIVIVNMINLLSSFLVYFLLHKMLSFSVSESLAGTGMDVLYGVFSKEHSRG